MIEVQPAPAEHYPWIAKRAGLVIGDSFRAIEVMDGERILGMVGFDGWTPNSCSLHIAVESPIALRKLAYRGFYTVFVGLKRGVALASVLSTNLRSQRMVQGLGFREVARLRDAWMPGVDMLIYEMRREECRWLEG